MTSNTLPMNSLLDFAENAAYMENDRLNTTSVMQICARMHSEQSTPTTIRAYKSSTIVTAQLTARKPGTGRTPLYSSESHRGHRGDHTMHQPTHASPCPLTASHDADPPRPRPVSPQRRPAALPRNQIRILKPRPVAPIPAAP